MSLKYICICVFICIYLVIFVWQLHWIFLNFKEWGTSRHAKVIVHFLTTSCHVLPMPSHTYSGVPGNFSPEAIPQEYLSLRKWERMICKESSERPWPRTHPQMLGFRKEIHGDLSPGVISTPSLVTLVGALCCPLAPTRHVFLNKAELVQVLHSEDRELHPSQSKQQQFVMTWGLLKEIKGLTHNSARMWTSPGGHLGFVCINWRLWSREKELSQGWWWTIGQPVWGHVLFLDFLL